MLAAVLPIRELVSLETLHTGYSTKVLAHEWILQNLPSGSRIAKKAFTTPLSDTRYSVFEEWSLGRRLTLDDYYRERYLHLVVASTVYQPYLSAPDRYKPQVEFYQRLFAEGRLLQQFEPSPTGRGPVISIYELPH